MLRLGLLASHRGSNVEAVVEACISGRLAAEPAVVISNNKSSRVLEFARSRGIEAIHIGGEALTDEALRDGRMLDCLREHDVGLVFLLGYMRLLGPKVLAAYRNRVLNIHPGALPKYGGKGMFGIHVHEAVLAAREAETTISIHLVDEQYDHGRVIAERKVPVLRDDSPDTLQARVLEAEHAFVVDTLDAIVQGTLSLPVE